uniref:Plexin b2a n=1 Tax=Salmo trutta TaxID=8032 RepID=A0A673XLY6_SALTR
MAWRWVLAAVLATSSLSLLGSAFNEFTSDTLINNVVQDPITSRLYVGTVNTLYQLDQSLHSEARTRTGPELDNRQCTPPVTSCEEAVETDTITSCSSFHPSKDILIVCGSLYRGIWFSEEPVYVEQVCKGYGSHDCTKRTMLYLLPVHHGNLYCPLSVLFRVAKGYGSHDSTKLISTRILRTFMTGSSLSPFFSPFFPLSLFPLSLFLCLFFQDEGFVYVLFSRTLGAQDSGTKNFTFISRIAGNKYNKVQAAYVALPGEALAKNMSSSGQYGPVVFVVFSSDDDSSAVCMYPLRAINQRLVEIIGACYRTKGQINNKSAVYSPYSSKSDELCKIENEGMVTTQRCGAEFLALPAGQQGRVRPGNRPCFTKKGLMTAVAVAVETEHAVAFLGTTLGEVLITKVPVQACHLKTDCKSCVAQKDPYCGWCVLQGKCTRKGDCPRAEDDNTWLWSPNQQCVQIQAFNPPNLSCRKTKQVVIDIPSLPKIGPSDIIECRFGSNTSEAVVMDQKVTCALPDPVNIPSTPDKQDFVTMQVKILVNDGIEVTSSEYKFYNCAATVRKSENTPCIACVTSEWQCQWNAQDHTCSDRDDSVDGVHIIKADSCPQFENPDPHLIPVGHPIPISFQGKNLDIYKDHTFKIGTELMKHTEEEFTFNEGLKFNFNGYEFSYDKEQEVNVSFHIKDRDSEKKIDSTLTVVLYNCSLGREDCSLCKNADPKYNCVWCANMRSCVYRKLCGSQEPAQCPNPKITDIIPRFGPLKGGIVVTIKGSNLGIKEEDIKKVTVAGVDCVHQGDRYSVSTSVVCEIGPVQSSASLDPPGPINQGVVEVEVEGGRTGRSEVLFTYRDPIPEKVSPSTGPAAGGTVITISGKHLDTANKDDVIVTVGGTPCKVLSFGSEITCETGVYKGQKVPSETLSVSMRYGKSTTKDVPGSFQYSENPKLTDYSPKNSFVCGGRRIVCVGSGFDLVQRASMKVLPSADDFSQSPPIEFIQYAVHKNDTVLLFDSPAVNRSSETQSFRTILQLDKVVEELKTFAYHPDPFFNELTKNIITETSIIIVTGRGFSKAMTAEEAQAFVGDASCKVTILQDDKLFLEAPSTQPRARSKRQRRDTSSDPLDLTIKFGNGEWVVGSVNYERKYEVPLAIIIPAVIVPMLLFIAVSVYCYRRKSQQAEREYEKVKHQLENLEESVRDRCKKEFTDLMIEMEDQTNDLSEARIPFLDYKTYTDRVFFLPSKDGDNDVMITGKLDIPEGRKVIVAQALNQFSNLLNSKTFLINFIKTLEGRPDFNARSRVYFASLLTVALHGKLEYYTDIMRSLLLELMEEYVHSKNPKLMLRRSETVVERMLCNWMSICLYQFLRDSAGEPLYKLFKAIKHQVEKGPVDAKMKKAKYTLNDTGLLGDDVEYCVLTLQVLVHGEGPDVTPVKVLNCDTISQVKEKIIEQVYRNLPYSQRPKVDSVALEWRPGSTGQILSDMDLTSQKEGRWKRLNTLAHYNVRDNATLVLSRVLHTHRQFHQNQDSHEEKNALLEDDKVFHLVRPVDELDDVKSKRGSLKAKATTKAIAEIYLTRLLSVKGTLQQFVDDFFRSVLCSGAVVPPAVKYFFDFLDEQALKHDNVEEETVHIWKTNSLPMRFWVNILKNPHFIFDVHVTEVVDASLSVIAQTFMDACTKTEHKLSRESPSNKLLYAKEISTYKKMVDDYYKGIKQMVPVSDQDMNTHLAEVSREHTDTLNTQAALHQLYQYASKYYDGIIQSLDEDPAAQSKQLTLRLQQIAAALENKVTDL